MPRWPIRGLLFATVTDPYLLVAVQVFDGITAAVFGVMIPLIVADVAFGSGHFNLAQGIVGTATGIGASLSTVLAGYVSDKFGSSVAFIGLAAVAAFGLLMIWLIMPETRPRLKCEHESEERRILEDAEIRGEPGHDRLQATAMIVTTSAACLGQVQRLRYSAL